MFLKINGLDQWVSVSGEPSNAVVMLVSGAGLALSQMSAYFAPWETAFRVLHWDQPGAGQTAQRSGPSTAAVTFDRLAEDGAAVAEAMRARLGVERLIL